LARGRKTRALLGYLCLHAGERVARSRICSLLWERVTDRQARSSLRQALFEMTSAIGPLAGELISADTDTVRLEPRLCWIDALAVFSSEPLPPQSFRSDLATMCTGELLDDLSGTTPAFDQWLLVERTRFNSRLRALYESEMEQLADASPARRAALARNVIVFDPTHEGASRMRMRALADLGERAQAIREYERCREALQTSLDVEPSSETRALCEAVRRFQGTQAVCVHEGSKPSRPAGGERLRIGVQPMRVGSDTPANGLGISLSREIAAGLARFRWFDVIPAEAAGASPSAPVHYIVDGDVRIGIESLRVAVRLLDVGNDHAVVWSDRFDLATHALDDVDQKVVAPIVARIDPVILSSKVSGRDQKDTGPLGWCCRPFP
jgi:DNA-binding SARP family transcriptional activator